MIVIEHAMHAKRSASRLVGRTGHLPHALDPQFFAALIRRGNKDFNSNIRSDRRTITAEDQRPAESNVTCETACRVLASVVPMKDDGQLQLVPHRSPPLERASETMAVSHTWDQPTALPIALQAADCLKIL
jgi:hypothetical protein